MANSRAMSLWHRAIGHLNFFRVHILIFTFTPIVAAGIFYGANGSVTSNANSTNLGRQKVEFIDCLFLCFSAMTTTGLCTVNLSALHPFQQFMLFFLFIVGDYSFASLIMVLVRKRYFRTRCEQLLVNDRLRREPTLAYDTAFQGFDHHLGQGFKSTLKKIRGQNVAISGPIAGHKIGHFVEDRAGDGENRADDQNVMTDSPVEMFFEENDLRERSDRPTEANILSSVGKSGGTTLVGTNPYPSQANSPAVTTTALNQSLSFQRRAPIDPSFHARQRLRSQIRTNSVNCGQAQPPSQRPVQQPLPIESSHHTDVDTLSKRKTAIRIKDHIQHSQTQSYNPHHCNRQTTPLHHASKESHSPIPVLSGHNYTGYGGFPTPVEIINNLLPRKAKECLYRPVRKTSILHFPTHHHNLEHDTEKGGHEESWGEAFVGTMAKWMPEGLQGLIIGRNSRFWTEELEDEELEQIGGVEYRALRTLSYLIPLYIFLYQMIPFMVIAIYLAKVHIWDDAFHAQPGVQAGTVNKTWFSLFLAASAYTGTGMSLTDQALLPFQKCYLIIYTIITSLLVGNHALPVMLRFIVWSGTKIFRRGERHETLHFLLDHPRRCFLYLFPSHQTWYLLFILLVFTFVELLAFLLLNIGLPVLENLNGWERFSDGLLQSLGVRAAGFGIIVVPNLAPAVLFIYIILMYVAIYPIAMSVRSTNVYEERGKFGSNNDEPLFRGGRREVFSKYLMWHMRRQLAFDVWPLAVAVFAICIFERDKILDQKTSSWFNIFRILFECTSAYATIGLTLGTPNNNYAFSGEFSTVSKLIIIMVMLRGRHRGLPVAIDRAILLPKEYSRIVEPVDSVQPNVSSRFPSHRTSAVESLPKSKQK
nr:potassium ion transporter [Cryptococcus depauperatus CBS 7841]